MAAAAGAATSAKVDVTAPGPLTLWYRQPAGKWTEALPVGNGRLGAMVFGAPANERIQLNEETIWDGYRRDANNPQALGALPEVRRLLFEGKNDEAMKLAAASMMGLPDKVKSYQTLGDLLLEFPGGEAQEYVRDLDLDTGIAGVRYTSAAAYRREVFASAPDDVIVVRIEAAARGKVKLRLRFTREKDAQCISEDGCLVLRGRIHCPDDKTGEERGMRFEGRLAAVCEGGSSTSRDGVLEIADANAVTLLIAAATDFRGGEPAKLCRETLDRSLKRSYAELRSRHVADHQKLFRRVSLRLGKTAESLPTDERLKRVQQGGDDPQLAALYFQFGRYLLMGSSRPGCLPANLQGVWNEHINAPWNSDYHTNINLQMNYWPAEVANLSECHVPLFDYMDNLLAKPGALTAKVHYGARGWVVHHLSDVFGFTAPADGIWGVWPMGAAWLARHPWEHYLFTGDKEWLRRQGYPLMKGAAQFILDFLVEAPAGTPVAGKLVPCPSHSPENRFRKADGTESMFTYAATMDVEICYDVLRNTADAAQVLGTDAEFRAECESTRKRLPPLRISERTGRLMEWVEDYEEPEPQHRHTSHLFALHPGRQISVTETPELAEAAKNVLATRGDISTGWSMAWRINFWARLRDGNHAHLLLTNLFRKGTLPNLFDTHPPFQIDGNFGGAAGITEMLLQSHAGEIHFLPALPSARPEGEARGLRARGGFEVDFAWAGGRLTRASLRSLNGGHVRVRTASGVREIDTQPGRTYKVPV